MLTALKRQPEFSWLNEVSAVALQQAIRHQDKSFKAFFEKRSRYPRFKSRRGRQSARFTGNAARLRCGELRLAKMVDPLVFVWSWHGMDITALDPSSVTVSRDPAERWFVTFSIELDDPEPLPATGQSVGVDLGLKDFLVLSNGEHIPHPKILARRQERLTRYQRQMARKVKGSANRRKARLKVARQHAKVGDARRDFLHKLSTDLVQRCDVIAIEDLAVANMVRNRSLARAISDSGWSEFRRMLEYKAARYGRHVHVVDRWYPSSKTCSGCGHLLKDLSLGTRHWTCPGCGTRHDRDVNAARNMIAAGLAAYACGGAVRPVAAASWRAPVKQEPPPRERAPA
jgi:putative transposase